MIQIGIVGVGFMGYTHFSASHDLEGARVAAIATRNERKLAGDWTSIQGNFGPPAGQVDLQDVRGYADYHDLLADPDIDLVDICLPNDLHEQVTIEALQAGKAVLVEKPIAVDVAAAERMVAASESAGRPLLVGHVLPFFPEFRYVTEQVRQGAYGKLLAAHFRRVITPPNWSAEMSDFRNLGGWGIDLHIHDNHFISVLCGVPHSVFSQGLLQEGFVNHVHTQYLFDSSDAAVSCVSGGIGASQLQFAHGFELFFERATMQYSAGTLGGEWVVDRPLTVITDAVDQPELPGGSEWYSAFTSELQLAVDSLANNADASLLSGHLALDALRICHAEARSIASGQIEAVNG